MIRLVDPEWPLSAEQRFARALLVDHARLLPGEVADAVQLRVHRSGSERDTLDLADVSVAAGEVSVPAEALDLVTRIAGAAQEQRSERSDRFGRVPPADNALVALGRERDAVVSRFAAHLRAAVVQAAGTGRVVFVTPWPDGRRWALAMTHDLDVVTLWPAFAALRAAELLRKGRLRGAAIVAGRAAASVAGDPVREAATRLLTVEERLGIRSTWFIITGRPTLATLRSGDITYAADSPAAKRIIHAARDAGHEIGLHGSFATYTDAARFRQERDRLSAIADRPVTGVRQHFVRMRPGTTHQAMREAGFLYDSTYGFSDRNGFRLGVADVVPVWHHATRTSLDLDELPFVWMDRALSKYCGVEDTAEIVADALAIASACRQAEGVWCGIWHPNQSAALGFPGAEKAFEVLCDGLMADKPWSATMSEIVAWRRARRDARAVGVLPSGGVAVSGAGNVTLEDAQGRPVPTAAQ